MRYSSSGIFHFLPAFLLILTVSCSHHSGIFHDPIVPAVGIETTSPAADTGYASHHYLWAYFEGYIDPEAGTFETYPVRAVGSHLNVVSFLEKNPCTNCFGIQDIKLLPGNVIIVNVFMFHPWGDPKFTGFDVRGIAMFNGSHVFPETGLVMSNQYDGDTEATSSQGYTTLYNSLTEGYGIQGYIKGKLATLVLPNATLNPYRRFISTGYSGNRNIFKVGDQVSVGYTVKFGEGPFAFGYAIDASWAPPIHEPVTDPVTDFGINANCPEAWKIDVTQTPVGNGLTPMGGEVDLTLDIYNWQGFDLVHSPLVECPELFDGTREATFVGNGDGFTIWTVTVGNEKFAPQGMYRCLIKKESAENDPVGKPWLDLTAYQVFTLEVDSGFNPKDVTPPWLNISPTCLTLDGDRMYTGGRNDSAMNENTRIDVFDISDPSSPQWLSRGFSQAYNDIIKVDGNRALIKSRTINNQVQLLDVSSPDGPEFLNGYLPNYASAAPFALDIDGNYGYVGSFHHFYEGFGTYHLTISDLSDPDDIKGIKRLDTTGIVYDVLAAGGYAYLATTGGLQVFDVDPAEDAAEIKQLVTSDSAISLTLYGDHAYCGTYDNNFYIFDISTPEDTYVVAEMSLDNTAAYVAAYNGYAYIADALGHFSIIDVDPPESPVVVASIGVLQDVSGLAARGGYVYAVNKWSGVEILDVDPPESAQRISMIHRLAEAREVTTSDGYAYVFEEMGKFIDVVDIDPTDAASVVADIEYTPFGGVRNSVVDDGYLYVASSDYDTHSGQFDLIDIDPIDSAEVVASIWMDDTVYDIAVENGYAFVTNGDSGLQVIDATVPSSAYIVKNVPTPHRIMSIALYNHLAFLTAYPAHNIYVVDVSDPSEAELTGYIDADYLSIGYPSDIYVSSGYAVVVGEDGLIILDVDPVDSAHFIDGAYMSNSKFNDVLVADGYAIGRCYTNFYRLLYFDIIPTDQIHLAGVLGAEFVSDMSLDGSTLAVACGGGLLLYDLY